MIRPLPNRLLETVKREARSLDESLPDFDDGEDYRVTHHHVVFRRKENTLDNRSISKFVNFYIQSSPIDKHTFNEIYSYQEFAQQES